MIMERSEAPIKADLDKSKALQLAEWLTRTAVSGAGPLSSAEQLAAEYLNDASYEDNESRIDHLIRFEVSKNFATGFVTGLGGFITLPVTIPASIGASWLLQARLVAAIARIYGHDISEDRVQTAILLVIIGQDLKEVLKQTGIRLGTQVSYRVIEKIPAALLTKINQLVGIRLLTKMGEKGIINLTKLVPVVGGAIGGTVDAISCRVVARTAKKVFHP